MMYGENIMRFILKLTLRKKAIPAIKQPKNVPAAEICMHTRILVKP